MNAVGEGLLGNRTPAGVKRVKARQDSRQFTTTNGALVACMDIAYCIGKTRERSRILHGPIARRFLARKLWRRR